MFGWPFVPHWLGSGLGSVEMNGRRNEPQTLIRLSLGGICLGNVFPKNIMFKFSSTRWEFAWHKFTQCIFPGGFFFQLKYNN